MIDVVAKLSSSDLMVHGDVWYATLKNLNGIQRPERMSDIIPLEVSRIDQMRVYTLQSVIWMLAKALYTI